MAGLAEGGDIDDVGTVDVVYVAVKEDPKESKSTLTWALRNLVMRKVVLVHVHPPLQFVNLMGASCLPSQLNSKQVEAQKLLEQEKIHKTLNTYANFCDLFKVQAEKLTIEWIDAAEGLMEVISVHGITKLVVGAASDKCYSKNMKEPLSKTARVIHTKAPPSCNIWFVCGGNLICTREAGENNGKGTPQSHMASPGSFSNQSETSPTSSIPPRRSFNPVSRFLKFVTSSNSPKDQPSDLWDSKEQNLNSSDEVPRSYPDSHPSPSGTDDSQSGSNSTPQDEGSHYSSIRYYSMPNFGEDDNLPPADDQQEFLGVDDDMYDKLQELLTEAEKLKYENFEESRKRHKAEREAAEAKHKIKVLHMKIAREIKLREETDNELKIQKLDIEEIRSLQDQISEELRATCDKKTALESQLLAHSSIILELEEKLLKAQEVSSLLEHERNELQEAKLELRRERDEAILELQEGEKRIYELRNFQDEMSEELTRTHDEKREVEEERAACDSILLSLQKELLAANQLISSLEIENENLLQERDDAFKEIGELHQVRTGERTSAGTECMLVEFSYSEIEQATRNFDDSLKVGEGGYGCVYKGYLRYTTVAIKIMNPLSLQGAPEFHREVDVLSRMRHPNLVTLVGVCPQAKALVYEYLPNGCLEDRLICKRGSPPLSWQIRIRICMEVCSALIFLHSNRPQCIVHGDLKPDNVLLDANFISKLSDFGISRLLVPPTTTSVVYHQTDPKGTYVYMDPELLATGILTTQSDVYAFGIIMLRLLTGKRPLGIVKLVQDALDERRLQEILDTTAGEWPFVLAQQLAFLGLRCSAVNRARRPDLVSEVLTVLEPMTRGLSRPSQTSYALTEDQSNNIPSYFLCPIFQEIMRDPQVAADGFTYEAEALRGWIETGHDTSPMTNRKLTTSQLIPNHSLRSAILEWLHEHGQHRL